MPSIDIFRVKTSKGRPVMWLQPSMSKTNNKMKLSTASKENKPTRGKNEDSNVVFVGQLPFKSTSEELHAFFSQFGTVNAVRMSRNSIRKSGKMRHLFSGVCHVEYADKATAQHAKNEIHHLSYQGRTLNADLASPVVTQQQTPTCEPSSTLYVANLPYNFDFDAVEALFAGFKGFSKLRAPELGVAKGWAYVQFDDTQSAQLGLSAMIGTVVGGRRIRLDFANSASTTNIKSNVKREAEDDGEELEDVPSVKKHRVEVAPKIEPVVPDESSDEEGSRSSDDQVDGEGLSGSDDDSRVEGSSSEDDSE